MQSTSHILMIRPVNFGFNAQTAVNNAFQVNSGQANVHDQALKEFDAFVAMLQKNGIHVTVVEDTPEPHTPDSIFPNNWISFHNDGTVVLYPMFAPNRRMERKPAVIEVIKKEFEINKTIDLTSFENNNIFLEGTGSMVLDRENRIAYACISPRTDKKLLQDFAARMNYRPVIFNAVDQNGKQIYHTNVMMCVADEYVVICLASIIDTGEKQLVHSTIEESGKKIIDITHRQVNHFAGNMLQVQNKDGRKFLVMSTQAYESLTPTQRSELSSFNEILHASLDAIEANGGGSARCMMAEIHLTQKSPATLP